MPKQKSAAQIKREQYKQEYWPSDIAWTGDPPEVGWFRAPRTLPLILVLLSDKKISGNTDPGGVYLDLLARHRDSGIVEMASEGEHSYSSGYSGSRSVRTWQERIKLLEKLEFIKSRKVGNQQYKLVLIVHPTVAVKKLHDEGRVDPVWWDTYRQRQIEAKEPLYEMLMQQHQPDKVVPIMAAKSKTQKAQKVS